MGFLDGAKKALKGIEQVAGVLAQAQHAHELAQRLLNKSEPVARRDLKHMSETIDSDTWKLLIGELDRTARASNGAQSDLAAKLAEYAEKLR